MLHIDLKQLMVDACFASSVNYSKLLHPYTRNNSVHLMFFFGICTSESVFLRLWDEEFEFLVKRSIKYLGGNLSTDLNVLVLIS